MISQIESSLIKLQNQRKDVYVTCMDSLTTEELEAVEEMVQLQNSGFDRPSVALMVGKKKMKAIAQAEAKLSARYQELTKGQMVNAKQRRPPQEGTT